MRLTRFSDIGLRVLMYLAQHHRAQPITVAEISAQFNVPHNHLVKVVGAMAKMGWIKALRGRNGGISLAVAPESLQLGTVLRVLEGDKEVVDCEGLACKLAGDCFLREALRAGLEAFYQSMNRYNLAQIVGTNTGQQIVELHRTFLLNRVETV